MAEKKEILIEIELNSERAEKRVGQLNKRLQEQKSELAEITKQMKAVQAAYDAGAMSAEDYTKEMTALSAEQVKMQNAVQATSQRLKVNNDILNSNANSIAAVEAENKRLNAILKQIDTTTESGAKAFEELNRKINENKARLKEAQNAAKGAVSAYQALQNKLTDLKNQYKDLEARRIKGDKLTEDEIKTLARLRAQIQETDGALKQIDADMGQFQRNVGNYKNAINEAIQENAGLFSSFGQGSGGAADFAGALGNLWKVLLANPIGAIIAAIGVLFAAFTQTAGGASKMKQVMGGLTGIFNKIIGDIGKVAENIVNLVSEPEKALKTIGDAIVTNLQNRIEGVINMAGSLSSVFKSLFAGDFEAAGKAAKDLGNATVQAVTGFENLAQKVSGYADDLAKAASDGVALVDLQVALEKQNRALTIQLEKLSGTVQLQRDIMNDATISFKERRAVVDEMFANEEKRAQTAIQLARNNLAMINAEINAKKAQGLAVSDLLQAQTDAAAAVIAAENEAMQNRRAIEQERRQMAQDDLELSLDILVDVADKQKTVNEAQIADARVNANERAQLLRDLQAAETADTEIRARLLRDFDKLQTKSFEQRRAQLEQTKADYRASSEEFVRMIEEQQGVQVDFDALLAESDTKRREAMLKEIGASEAVQNRIREILQERLQAEQDFVDLSNQITDEEIDYEIAARQKQLDQEMQIMQLRADNEMNGVQARLALLNYQYQQELIAAENNEMLKAEIAKKYANARMAIEREVFNKNIQTMSNAAGQFASIFEEQTIAFKVFASAQAIMNTFLGATQVLSDKSLVTAAKFVGVAGVIASGLASVAKINNVKFAKGAKLVGPSHANGGIPFSIGGQLGFEAEGGEYIVNKRSTAKSERAIDTINSNPNIAFKAIPMQSTYADGGMLRAAATTAMVENEYMSRAEMVQAISLIKPQVTVNDIYRAEQRVEVRDRFTKF